MIGNSHKILIDYLSENNHFSTLDYMKLGFTCHSDVVEIVKDLQLYNDFLEVLDEKKIVWSLTADGQKCLEDFKTINVPEGELDIRILHDHLTQIKKEVFENIDQKLLLEYEKLGFIFSKGSINYFFVTKGNNFTSQVESDLTYDMITSGSWKFSLLSAYNFEQKGLKEIYSSVHPVYEFLSEIRNILLILGFSEIPNCNYVQKNNILSLGDFDKGTIYNVQTKNFDNENYTENSLGQILSFNILNILTDNADLFKKENNTRKFFTIDKIFRNEMPKDLILSEFHNVEFILFDSDANFSHLLGIIEELLLRLNVKNVEYKSISFPYTSPSVGCYVYHEDLDTWILVGKGGILRPEILKEIGLKEETIILRWGISLERLLSAKKEMEDINTFIGFCNDLI